MESFLQTKHNNSYESPIKVKLVNLLPKLMNCIKPVYSKVLDIGCGVGFYSNLLRSSGYNVIGMDISEEMLKEAKKRYPHIEFICNSIESTSFKNDSFDAIIAIEVIEHVFDIHKSLLEINRILRKDAYLILTVPYHGLIKNILISLFFFERHYLQLEHIHYHFFTNRMLKRLFNKYGFRVCKIRYIGRIPVIAKSILFMYKKI